MVRLILPGPSIEGVTERTTIGCRIWLRTTIYPVSLVSSGKEELVGKHKSIIREAIERLDGLMAIGESRFAAKCARRAQGETLFAFSTGRIHCHRTRIVYQGWLLQFVAWCRERYQLRHLEQVDARAEELASAYLRALMAEGKSPYTLHSQRSALRLFFGERRLSESVVLPPRRREGIRRSRGPVAQDRQFQPANWQAEIQLLESCGLRRSEALALRVGDIHQRPDGRVEIFVYRGKGGRSRLVPVLPGREEAVLAFVRDRTDPDARVVVRLPKRLDVHALRRSYAQQLYRYLSGRALPSPVGKLRPEDYDREAARAVSRALGHNRLDVVLTHYLR
jgi:integrase